MLRTSTALLIASIAFACTDDNDSAPDPGGNSNGNSNGNTNGNGNGNGGGGPTDGVFVTFESGPVRPVALSADGSTLVVTNIPDGRLEVFDVGTGGLTPRASIPVGLEPVAVALRSNTEAWVVNHLSDSVSIVDLEAEHVARTLLVGDEPRDIVFAGDRAFITTAHRGQRRTDAALAAVPGAGDPQLTTAGVGRADVWVFEASALGDPIGGTPIEIVVLFGDTPRALAVTPDEQTVYVAVFNSGNQTTVLHEEVVCDGFAGASSCVVDGVTVPGGNPGPSTNAEGDPAPEVGLIVRLNPSTEAWEDELGRDWSDAVRFELPDYDVFAIDAATLAETAPPVAHVGTTLFNMAVNPVSGALYVSNTESRNEVRFEGSGEFGGSTVQGHLAEARITVIEGETVSPRHLNKHIPYDTLPAPSGVAEHSLATPVQLEVSSDGSTLYVAAYGSARIGVYDTAALETDSFDPTALSHIDLDGGGPGGFALDEARGQIYVYTRFDNQIRTIELGGGAEVQTLAMRNPEPPEVTEGRPFLYDARLTSSNGEASCASCHVFGDMDHLSWDLGDPDGAVSRSPIEIKIEAGANAFPKPVNGTGDAKDFHPMKGPMNTQTLRGMVNSGAQHWRGDRSDGLYGVDAKDSDLSFRNFNVAFPGLVGRDDLLSDEDMQRFADFALALTLPPNPVRNLDNSLTPPQQAGFDFYTGERLSDGVDFPGLGFTCDGCHTLAPENGFFGTNGDQSFEQEVQIMKIPHLRNLYQKVGMFGGLDLPFFEPVDDSFTGPQVRGFGMLHDGSVDTLFRFFSAEVFSNRGDIGFPSDAVRAGMEELMLAFDSDLAPIVGQQVTVSNVAAATARITLLITRCSSAFTSKILGGSTVECDLVAHDGTRRAWLRDPATGEWTSDDGTTLPNDEALGALVSPERPITLTAVPPGSGRRVALGDGF